MGKTCRASTRFFILYPILALAALTTVFAPSQSVRSFAEFDLPPPWDKVTNLSEEQKGKIQEILKNTATSIETRKQTIREERTAILKQRNALRLAKMDIAQWTKEMIKIARQQERDQIMGLLSPNQRGEAAAALANILQTVEIVEFQAFKARQQNDYFCWAACLQMVFNYAGVDWDQDQIANEIMGNADAQTATPQEISKGGTGWRVDRRDQSKTWSANVTYHEKAPEDSLVVGMLGFNTFMFIELGSRHVGILYRSTYREAINPNTGMITIYVDTATIYDPLTGSDVTIKWSDDAAKQITGWWEARAIVSDTRRF